jgi:CRISPR system Cascade subunit CasE
MMPTAFLTRVRLREVPSVRAIMRMLVPQSDGDRLAASHHLVWMLFADEAERKRDFLWREIEPGEFLILSKRPPVDAHQVFNVDSPKPFMPRIEVGSELQFLLRANPTVDQRIGPDRQSRRHDVVMAAIHASGGPNRAEARRQAIQTAGRKWLVDRAERNGFDLSTRPVRIDGYQQLRAPRKAGDASPMTISTLDYSGQLVVTDPARFITMLVHGMGRARAFGCGLMLVR